MRPFRFDKSELLISLLGLSMVLMLLLSLANWDVVKLLKLLGFAFLCIGVPFFSIVGFGWVMAQVGKIAVDSGRAALHQRKRHPDEVWLDTPHTLNYDGRYTIGDDGELMDVSDTDETPKHNQTTD